MSSFSLGERLQANADFEIKEAKEVVRVGHTQLYKDRQAGLVKFHKVGRRSFISGSELLRYMKIRRGEVVP